MIVARIRRGQIRRVAKINHRVGELAKIRVSMWAISSAVSAGAVNAGQQNNQRVIVGRQNVIGF